jgi:hypothetical protein
MLRDSGANGAQGRVLFTHLVGSGNGADAEGIHGAGHSSVPGRSNDQTTTRIRQSDAGRFAPEDGRTPQRQASDLKWRAGILAGRKKTDGFYRVAKCSVTFGWPRVISDGLEAAALRQARCPPLYRWPSAKTRPKIVSGGRMGQSEFGFCRAKGARAAKSVGLASL